MAQKPSIPKGTRDFNPEEVAKRNYIFNVIKQQFEVFGFQPIETPSFENSDTLMGKYGEEGDRLIFKILDSGDFLRKAENEIDNFYFFKNQLKQQLNHFSHYLLNKKGDAIKDCDLVELNKLSVEISEDSRIIELFNISFDWHKRLFDKNVSRNYEIVVENWYKYLIQLCVEAIYDSKTSSDSLVAKFTGEDEIIIDLDSLKFEAFYKASLDNEFNSQKLTKYISEKALRYDLTVPFARYVVQHQNEIEFPFKRYQIQPVWRADRPQKGRFREFYQCDADVVGSTSLWQEVEFVQLYDAVFTALKLEGVTIKINNRKILSGIAEVIGAQDKLIDFTVALDKLDKIGEEKVKEEMLGKGIPQSGIDKLQPLFSLSGTFESQVSQLKSILSTSEEGKKGIEELEFIDKAITELGLKTATLQLDVTLARGLNYYTGAIYEVSAPKGVDMGSIGGGGRYDDLTGIFGLKDVSGVGISFGLDRIYLVIESLNLFPETITNTVKALFINFGEAEAMASMKAVKALRENGVSAELFPDNKKTIKQFNYANKRNIPNVVLVGESELASNTFTLKNMSSGDQQQLTLEQLIKALQ